MKKGKLYLIIFFASTLSLFLLNSCGDDDKTVNNPPPSGGAFTLSGSVNNYPGGSVIAKARLLKFVPPDSFFCGVDTIDNNGELSMALVTPPTDYLGPINVPPGITVSDSTAAITSFSELGVYNFSGAPIAKLRRKNFADSNFVEGSFQVYYFFSTKAVSITGSDTSININDTTINTFNINFTAGWNALSIRLTALRPNYSLTEYLSGELTGALWRYETSAPLRRFNYTIVN